MLATTLKFKQKCSTKTAQAIESASDSAVVQALAERIKSCNCDENLYVGGGRRGSLWSCQSHFCSNCLSRKTARTRPLARHVFSRLNKARRRFCVLTLPDDLISDCSLDKQIAIAQYAWRELYRHSEWYQKTIKGTIKTLEYTTDESRANPYHVHINLLTDSPFIAHLPFKEDWTKAVKIAVEHFGKKWETPKTANGFLNVYLKRIVAHPVTKQNEHKEINQADVVFEVVKYVTKNDSWQKLPAAQLAEVCENDRFFRFFEVTGTCRKVAREIRPEWQPERVIDLKTGATGEPDLNSELNQRTYFNNQSVIVRKKPRKSDCLWKPPPKPRKKSWFSRLKSKEISLDQYKGELVREISNTIEFRKAQLRSKYGQSIDFFTLDGECF